MKGRGGVKGLQEWDGWVGKGDKEGGGVEGTKGDKRCLGLCTVGWLVGRGCTAQTFSLLR